MKKLLDFLSNLLSKLKSKNFSSVISFKQMTLKRNVLTLCIVAASISIFLTACGSKEMTYNDGTYTGKSSVDEFGAYAVVDLTIENGEIAEVSSVTMEKDGTIKDSEYGKTNGKIENQSYYDKAQAGVAGMEKYEQQLAETGNLEEVDAISGATISFDQFNEAVNGALEQAK